MEPAASGSVPTPLGHASVAHPVALPDASLLADVDTPTLRALLDAWPLKAWTADATGNVDFANRVLRAYLGSPASQDAVSWFDALHPEDAAAVLAAWRVACDMEEPLDVECRLRQGQGDTPRWMQLQAAPMRDAAGRLIRWFGAAVDIHDRHMSERHNSKLARRLTRTLESVTDGFFTLDMQWRFTYVNSACERLLLRTREELLGLDIRESPGFEGSEFYRQYAIAFSEGRRVDFDAWSAQGRIWLGVRAYPGEDGLSVYFADVTPQHEAREEEQSRLGILQIQREIASASGFGLEALMRLVAQRVRVLMHADGCEVLLVEGGRLFSRAAEGSTVLPLGVEASPNGLSTAAARGTEVVYSPDALADARVDHALAHRIGVRSMLAAPMRAGNQPEGVLLVTSSRVNAFAPRDIVNLHFLAQSLGAVIQRHRFDALLRASEAQYRMLFDNNPQPMWVMLPSDMRMLAVNRSALLHYGYTRAEFLALDVDQLWDRASLANPEHTLAEIRANRKDRLIAERHRRSDGSFIDVEIFADPITFDGMAARLVLALDVTERHRTDALLRDQAALLDKAREAIVVRRADQRIRYWNGGAEQLYGWAAHEASGRVLAELLHGEAQAFRAASQVLARDGAWTGELLLRRRDGHRIAVEDRWTLLRDDAGAMQEILSISTDITQRKEAEQAIHRLAFYDALTRLPNRQRMAELLDAALARSAASGQHGALLFVDVDDFKTVNDTLGHDQGDDLLRQIGERLRGCVGLQDMVGRFGGDEFLVLLEPVHNDAETASSHASALAEAMLAALRQQFALGGDELVCSSSIGAALYGPQTRDAGELLRQTDLALHEAKQAGRNTLRLFEARLQQQVVARARMETELRQTIAERGLEVHLQPQAENGRVVGFEALVRWPRADGSMVSPAEFIPLAEQTGLILDLGLGVLERVCTLVAPWRTLPALQHMSVAVNVSARQFHHHAFVGQLRAVLAHSGVDPHQIKLELTEGMLVEDVEGVIAKMVALRALGLRISLDDFGTGYSSLAYLKRLPLDQLKIDQSFVRELLVDPKAAAIAQTIIALARSLDLQVIAEGVETEAQRALLAQHGCVAYQGYLLARPMPPAALCDFLDTQGDGAAGAALRTALSRKPH